MCFVHWRYWLGITGLHYSLAPCVIGVRIHFRILERAPAPATVARRSRLEPSSRMRPSDRRKLFTPSECRKFGRAEWGALYDYPKLARVRAALRYEKVQG